MTIGEIIKKHRKDKGLTQPELASRLGATPLAVRNWENGRALPDIALLAPLAQLLDIPPDELLPFQEEYTDEDINEYCLKIQKDLENQSYCEVFAAAKETLERFPHCEKLLLQVAFLLDANRETAERATSETYDSVILGWYERCLHSKDRQIQSQAADTLFHAYFQKEDYEKALSCLDTFSPESFERKHGEALVYSKTGKKPEAYRAYEELIFTGYQRLQMTLNNLRILYMEDGNHEMAKKLVDVSSRAASVFEMGKYHEVSSGLDVAAWEKDPAWTEQLMHDILNCVETIGGFAKSTLYQHMALKAVAPEFSEELRQELLVSFTDESFHYMRGNEYWEKLKDGIS